MPADMSLRSPFPGLTGRLPGSRRLWMVLVTCWRKVVRKSRLTREMTKTTSCRPSTRPNTGSLLAVNLPLTLVVIISHGRLPPLMMASESQSTGLVARLEISRSICITSSLSAGGRVCSSSLLWSALSFACHFPVSCSPTAFLYPLVLTLCSDVWVQWWAAANEDDPNGRLGYWLGVYAALGGAALVCLFLSC